MRDEELRHEERRTKLGEPSRRRLVELTRLASALEETWLAASVHIPKPHAPDCGWPKAQGEWIECTCDSNPGEDKASTADPFHEGLVEKGSVEVVLAARRTETGRLFFEVFSRQLRLLDSL